MIFGNIEVVGLREHFILADEIVFSIESEEYRDLLGLNGILYV